MMYSTFFTTVTLLCICSLFWPGVSLKCSATQYIWPYDKPQNCCNKCPPGQQMIARDPKTCDIQCENCTGKRYTDSYNVGTCNICNNCNKVNMEYMSPCNNTHNAVCRCKAGYRCGDESCAYCTPTPPTTTMAPTTTTLPPTTTTLPPITTTLPPTTITLPPSTTETAWFLVIICLLCLGIILVIVTKIKPVLKWFTYKKGYSLARIPLAVPATVYIEDDEDVCKPVQEVCGKCDQPIDI